MIDLIDTHQHLIYPDEFGYGWTDGIPELAGKAFTLDDYEILTANSGVIGTVFMESGANDADYKREARFIEALRRDNTNGILGLIASCRPEEDKGFSDWLDECTGLGVVGFRRVLHVMPDDLSASDTFRHNLLEIGRRGLPFDLCLMARQLPIGTNLARHCGNMEFVLDHCGVPDIAAREIEVWRKEISAVADLPNITCKLSGILAYCAPGHATIDSLRPYFDHILETFGPKRIIWGSDWPVVDTGGGLPKWLDITSTFMFELSDAEQLSIGVQTAKRVYKLD